MRSFLTLPTTYRLCQKLSPYGINGPILNWIVNILCNIYLKDSMHAQCFLPCSLRHTQGYVLGPGLVVSFMIFQILFYIYS